MRTNDVLFELEEISILYQYLYMDESHFITIDNGVAKLEVRMTDDGFFTAKNLNFPEFPPTNYTDMMVVPNLLGIIDQLKEVPPEQFTSFGSRWEELRTITLSTVALNKMKFNR